MHTISDTIGDIYEAAINPSHWDVALTSMVSHCKLENWDVAFLVWESPTPPYGRFLGATGVTEYAREGYVNFFAGRNPWTQKVFNLPNGQVVHSDELLSRQEFKESDLYKNFLHMWEMETALISAIDSDGASKLGLVLPGPDNGPTNLIADLLRLFTPHIQRACRISRKLGEADLRANSALSVLEDSQNSIFLLGDDNEIFFANNSAKNLIDAGYFDEKSNKLRFNCRNSDAKLKSNPINVNNQTLALNLIPDNLELKRALLMHIKPQIADTLMGTLKGANKILIVNNEALIDLEKRRELFREYFDFTNAESRLALALVRGLSLEQFAIERGVSVNAARFLIRGLYHKTATNKQAQLVKILNEIPNGIGV